MRVNLTGWNQDSQAGRRGNQGLLPKFGDYKVKFANEGCEEKKKIGRDRLGNEETQRSATVQVATERLLVLIAQDICEKLLRSSVHGSCNH